MPYLRKENKSELHDNYNFNKYFDPFTLFPSYRYKLIFTYAHTDTYVSMYKYTVFIII